MANHIQLQSDISVLGLRGLGAFTNMLAALSADNVTPMAMLQMEQLGAAFHINGNFALKVPELLKRTCAQPLGRLALTVGWYRGDSISLMAESAGGQAVSLLSLCLINIYRQEAAGDILSRLCHGLLPRALPVSSVSHLSDVAMLLASKLNALGFGNVLAQQVVRVFETYAHLRIEPPKDFLDIPSVESIVNVLESLHRIQEEGFIIRITGSCGVGQIIGIVLFMFPLDAVITVESFIIHEGPRQRVIIEVCSSGPTQVQVEKELNQPPFIQLPIEASESAEDKGPAYYFAWPGCLARKLQLEFARFGSNCTQDVLVACCNLLVELAPEYRGSYIAKKENNLPMNGIEGLLGPYARYRMEQVCETVLLATPTEPKKGIKVAYANLISAVEQASPNVNCSCSKCVLSQGWNKKASKSCPHYQLWEHIGSVLTAGLYCFLVNIRGTVAISGNISLNRVADMISHHFDETGLYQYYTERLCEDVKRTFTGVSDGDLGVSSGACTIYPTVLETFQVHPDGIVSFELVDGRFVFEGRYFTVLSSSGVARPRAKKPLLTRVSKIVPSNHGEHSTISITLREGYKKLLLHVTARFSGSNVRIDLASVLHAYIGLERTTVCDHTPTNPLRAEYLSEAITTGIASPRAAGSKLALAMTHSNPVAQFLCCEPGAKQIILYECCLNCGFRQARGKFDILIVS